MNKTLTKIFIIIFLFIFVYFITDYTQYKIYKTNLKKELKKEKMEINIPTYHTYFYKNYGRTISSFKEKYKDRLHKDFRPANIIENTKKPSIIIFGCSFAYGSFLDNNETFASKLSYYTKRNVYNRALDGCGIQHMYYFLQDDNFFKHISPAPDYVIYLYIENQLERLNATIFPYSILTNGKNLRYKLSGNKLILDKDNFLIKKSFLLRKLILMTDKKYNNQNQERKNLNFKLANKLFLESKKILETKYPNIKFVIIKYDYNYFNVIDNYQENNLETKDMWKILKEEGFIIINTKDIIGKSFDNKYTTEDKYHTNEKAWDLLVPKIVERLEL